MMIRRLVTGHDSEGRSIFLSDGPTPATVVFQSIPDHALAQVWTTPPTPVLSAQPIDPARLHDTLLPAAGGTSLLIVKFPPDQAMATPQFDPVAAGAEYSAVMPDLAATFEPEHPGMHTTPTIDYAIVLSGDISLEVDGSDERQLHPMDIVVQNGTRHAWRNRGDAPAVVAFFMIGVPRA